MNTAARNAAIAFPIAVAVVVLDQAVKSWLLTGFHLAAVSPAPLFGPIRLNLSFNNGVSFGFLRGDAPWAPYAFAGFALVVTVALGVWALRAPRPITAAAIGFVMGGAVGNLVDRVTRGAVVDFIDASALHFPWVFNLADSAITVGVALLLLEGFVSPKTAA
jgi:signal peptidase II